METVRVKDSDRDVNCSCKCKREREKDRRRGNHETIKHVHFTWGNLLNQMDGTDGTHLDFFVFVFRTSLHIVFSCRS